MSRERRRLFQEEESPVEPGRFGCPMLTRGHRSHPVHVGQPMMRCCLGWAIREEIEVERCLATEAVIDCWKEHPERTPMVVLTPAKAPEVVEIEQQASAD